MTVAASYDEATGDAIAASAANSPILHQPATEAPSLQRGPLLKVPFYGAVDTLMLPIESLIVYESGGLTVINKPPGLQSTGRSLEDSNCAQYLLMARARRMVWAVHQIDADTSGLLVFTTKRALVPIYQQRLLTPNGQKTYLAICNGNPDWEERVVDAPIGDFNERGDYRYGVNPNGKTAKTRFRVRARAGAYCLMTAELFTGRTHQIRVHLQHEGLTLVGENRYIDTPCREHHRQALHAWRLRFSDGEEPSGFDAPLPQDLSELAARLGLEVNPSAWDDLT